MYLRPLAVSLLIFIFFIIGIYQIYLRSSTRHLNYQINPQQYWLGVIDMNSDHGIDMAGVIRGEDSLLTLDYTNPALIQLTQSKSGSDITNTIKQFELARYDNNVDRLISQDDPIFPFLRVITFDPDTKNYHVGSLLQSGIRGIRIYTIDNYPRYQAILSDGTLRNLYMTNNIQGTALYRKGNAESVTLF